ncbi:polynucleotide 5'-hydroxyl-kinase NOL9 isoform X2 [Prionailurus viverrinus]|uniref:polynucleotide 5'-hydroxyl-kinase NOL9 isoform X2 n=1 Tax=Prionailurus bengalensis TaxID=37029 RepID=UPI001CA92747|nr:polynucleotide 5'-hydroxyl-kinase NOL9 isoform X2 [Prionailurus bengalensis]XP_047726051.1 polynucleotide 5'-hydroxyl-kinase NOL9 isoform X2 [Prionailurus viverrinus]
MADAQLLLKRGPSRSTWLRARKARPQLVLSRRPRRRLGTLRWCGRRRLRRRLLQAQAAGADWRESGCLVSRSAARRPKTAAPSPAPAAAPAPSCPTTLPIPPVRPAGPGRALLLLPRDQGFTFSGICRVTCLYGQVQVLGYTISQGHPAQDVFSTYTHSRLTINAVHYSVPEKSKKEVKREARALLRSHLNRDDRCWLMKNFSPLCSIVMLEQLRTSTVNFLVSHPGLSYVFVQESPTFQINSEHLALRSVGIKREKKKNGLRLTESALSAMEELVTVSCEVDGCPVILVCGSQDVGKSTFNRYLINQLLNSISCVDYLECDLGQTEFTPPGCISLLNITEPILGPPFTHQRTPQKMVYYGKPSCKNNYENYIEIIQYVFSSYKREAPLIVNTMGWVSDQGLLLLIDLIRLLSPSHVVQFSSGRSKYMPNLTPDYVDDMDGLYTKSKSRIRNRGFQLAEFTESLEFADEEKESPVVFTGHKLICVQSDFAFRKTPRNRESHNKVLRDLAVLGYLGQLQPPVPKPLYPLHGLTPYQVPFNAVALRITHADVAPTHILYAVNASWVGLCKILDDVRGYANGPILLAQTPICDCLGFGICRGIDMEKRLYHILTPVPPEELRNVNCLLVGAISIPQCVFKSQRGLEGTIPYVTTDYNSKLPGASEKIGARETEETREEKVHPKPKLYRKIN